jgi:PTS system mannose-specific IIC component
LLSGLASVDRNSALNLMISRPLVISSIIGLMYGQILNCIAVGVLFEIIGLIDIPVGTHIPRDDTFAAYNASLLLSLNRINTASDLLIALLLIILFIYPVTFTEKILRKFNQMLFLRYRKRKHASDISPLIYRGILMSFVRGVIVYNLMFLLLDFLTGQLEDLFELNGNIYKAIFLCVAFCSGYLVRFLNFKSFFKYLAFVFGLFLGWLLL